MINTKLKAIAMVLILLLIMQIVMPIFVYAAEDISTTSYKIKNGYITRILEDETVGDLLANINSNETLKVYKENNLVENSEKLVTGMKLKGENLEYTLIVMGDINCNGKQTATDLSMTLRAYVGLIELDEIKQKAVDINEDGKISTVDLSKARRLLVGIEIEEIKEMAGDKEGTDDPTNTPGDGDEGTDDPTNTPGDGDEGTDDPTNTPGDGDEETDDPTNTPGDGDEGTDDPTNTPGDGDEETDDPTNTPGDGDEETDDPTNTPGDGDEETDDPTNTPGDGDEETDDPSSNPGEEITGEIVINESTSEPTQSVTINVTWPSNINGLTKQISVDGGNTYTTYTNEIIVRENTTVYARLIDENSKVVRTASIKITNIDTVVPKSFEPTVTNIGEKTFTIIASTEDGDATTTSTRSGIKEYMYFIKEKDDNAYTETTANVIDLIAGKTYNIYVDAYDNAGNKTRSSIIEATTLESVPNLIVDNNVFFTCTPDSWTNTNVKVAIRTEIQGYILQYSLDEGANWNTYIGEISITKNNQTISARLADRDRYGDAATKKIDFIDTLTPKAFKLTATANVNTITVTGTTTDASATETSGMSGIRGYQYKIDSEEWTEETTNTSYTFTGLTEETTYTVSMRAIDNAGNITEVSNKNEEVTTKVTQTNSLSADGSFDTIAKVNSPDTSKLDAATTEYVRWSNSVPYTEQLSSEVPSNWYDYSNGKWANIKSTGNNLEAYWVWIPRFAYKLPESETAKEIEVIFVQGNGKTGANGETCYYATDTAITTDGSGLYSQKTSTAAEKWIVHPAFTFGTTQLSGIWMAKYEASSNLSYEDDEEGFGGGNTTALQVQVKPEESSWRGIQLANAFTVCTNMKKDGGVMETANSASIDTHMVKNIEWGAVAILSQSEYGVFNPTSNTNRVWSNPSSYAITGQAGGSVNAYDETETYTYNTENGIKASTTGTVYGVYDMSGCAYEYVMGIMAVSSSSNEPQVGVSTTETSGFAGKIKGGTTVTGTALPDSKYYDLYPYNWATDRPETNKGFIGDATSELLPKTIVDEQQGIEIITYVSWNNKEVCPVAPDWPIFNRGGICLLDNTQDIFWYDADDRTRLFCSFI